MPPKYKNCRNPDCPHQFLQFNSLQKYCSASCQNKYKNPKRIKPISDKRTVENVIYNEQKEIFFANPKNQQCFIDGCYNPATTVEHSAGRKGYYDDWARENGISLFLDVRFWRPCCVEHNFELETNSELSKKYQLSKIHGGKKL